MMTATYPIAHIGNENKVYIYIYVAIFHNLTFGFMFYVATYKCVLKELQTKMLPS